MKHTFAPCLFLFAVACGVAPKATVIQNPNTTEPLPVTFDGNYVVTFKSQDANCDLGTAQWRISQDMNAVLDQNVTNLYWLNTDAEYAYTRPVLASQDGNQLSWTEYREYDEFDCNLDEERVGLVTVNSNGLSGTLSFSIGDCLPAFAGQYCEFAVTGAPTN